MVDSAEDRGYLKPRTRTPSAKQQKKQGMFMNQPQYMDSFGEFNGPSKLHRSGTSDGMRLEKGGPSSQRGKPIG